MYVKTGHNNSYFTIFCLHCTFIRCMHGPHTRYVKLGVTHALGMPGTFSPPPWVSDPDIHHGTCMTHVPWCIPGSLISCFLWSSVTGKTVPAFQAHAQPAILCIWQEAHGDGIILYNWWNHRMLKVILFILAHESILNGTYCCNTLQLQQHT